MYTVKQVSDLAGVTPRTLHHYDQIGLLKPSQIAANGYRYYDEQALLRLQQILFYRELGLDLAKIRNILDDEGFDPVTALQSHHAVLQGEIARLQTLVNTVEATIMHLLGEVKMSKKNVFKGFSREQEEEYNKQAIEQWGEDAAETIRSWNERSQEEKECILAEGGQIYQEIIGKMAQGPESEEVQALLARWHQHLRNFYEPTFEILRGLGNSYNDHPDFNATFTAMDPALPAFLQQAINHYVDALELEWIEREMNMLEE